MDRAYADDATRQLVRVRGFRPMTPPTTGVPVCLVLIYLHPDIVGTLDS